MRKQKWNSLLNQSVFLVDSKNISVEKPGGSKRSPPPNDQVAQRARETSRRGDRAVGPFSFRAHPPRWYEKSSSMLLSMQLTRTVLGSKSRKLGHLAATLGCRGGCTILQDTQTCQAGTDAQCRNYSPARTVHWMELPVQGCGIHRGASIFLSSLQKSPFHTGSGLNGAPFQRPMLPAIGLHTQQATAVLRSLGSAG